MGSWDPQTSPRVLTEGSPGERKCPLQRNSLALQDHHQEATCAQAPPLNTQFRFMFVTWECNWCTMTYTHHMRPAAWIFTNWNIPVSLVPRSRNRTYQHPRSPFIPSQPWPHFKDNHYLDFWQQRFILLVFMRCADGIMHVCCFMSVDFCWASCVPELSVQRCV